MNMVIIKHPNDNGKYLFRVPDFADLDAGTMVMCETGRGLCPGICATATFRADPEVICSLWGTVPKNLKRIVSYMFESKLNWPDEPVTKEPIDDDEEP